MKSLEDKLDDETEKEMIHTYRQAIIDYHLIYSTGIAVSSLADSGCDINEIDFNKVKEYYRSQGDEDKWKDFSKILSSSDRDVEAWLNGIISIQKKEVLNSENVSFQIESRDGTEYYRINVTDTPKRIIDIPVLTVTAKTDNEPFCDPTMAFYGSAEDSSYLIPKFDGQWYVVEDSKGTRHLASGATDKSVYASFSLNGKSLGEGELLFDNNGNAKSIYVYGNTKPISLDSLDETVMVTLENDPFGPGAGPVDMPFILEKTNARLIKDHYSNLGIEDLEIKLAISDMYGVEHEIRPEPTGNSVAPSATSIDNAPVVLDDAPIVYTGQPVTPVIQTIGGKTLQEGRDYTIRYTQGDAVIEAPTDAGTYTMTITGKGNYAGSTSTEFTISKADGTLTATGNKVKARSKTIKLKKARKISADKAYTIKGAIGELTFSKVKANKVSKKFKVNAKSGQIKAKKGLKKGKYKLTVLISDPGDKNHKAAEAEAIVKIKIRK